MRVQSSPRRPAVATPVVQETGAVAPGQADTPVEEHVDPARTARCSALGQAHATVRQALEAAPQAEALLAEHDRIAVPDHGLSAVEFDQAELRFARSVGQSLQGLAALAPPQGDERPKYGGSLGNGIFQHFSVTVTVPALKDIVDRLATDTRDLPLDQARTAANTALSHLIDRGGRDRTLVAHMTDTKDAALFGKRMEPEGYLLDPVSSRPAWTRWASRIDAQISSHFLRGQHARTTSDRLWPGQSPWPDGTPVHVIASRDGTTRVVLNTKTSEGFYESTGPASARYAFRLHDSSVREIDCHHIPAPADQAVETAFEEDFFHLIRLRDPSVNELRDGLARLLHRISHSSLLFRGGAALTERMLDALARHHGYQIGYSAAWTPPDGIQPDQQALSAFDIDVFVASSAGHILLNPIPVG